MATHNEMRIPPPICYAGLAGLHDVVQMLIKNGADVQGEKGHHAYGGPLQAPSYTGSASCSNYILTGIDAVSGKQATRNEINILCRCRRAIPLNDRENYPKGTFHKAGDELKGSLTEALSLRTGHSLYSLDMALSDSGGLAGLADAVREHGGGLYIQALVRPDFLWPKSSSKKEAKMDVTTEMRIPEGLTALTHTCR